MTDSRSYAGSAWVVRYWWIEPSGEPSPEQTAHFLDMTYNYDPEVAYAAAVAYAGRPSTAGKPVLRVEIQRTRFGKQTDVKGNEK